MLQKYKSMNAAAWILLFGMVVTIQWTIVTSATITTDVPFVDLKSESSEEQNHVQIKNDNNLFYSDELDSSEYDDGLDADSTEQKRQQDHEWDVLVFTQQWPITTCYHWREEDKDHRCTLPSKSEFWTIHGVWPTKLGHIGPGFCNKTAEFNLDILQPIVDRLELFWPDIDGEANFDFLWKHEWLKHGTCAAGLDELNNELKYFGQGLKWRNEYLMGNILAASGIHPDSNNTVVALHTAVIQALGKNPSIHCIYDNKNDVSYLAEIRICFDKSLELIDCDGVKLGDAISIDYPGGNVNTNCHISKPVHYPSLVPQRLREQNDKWKFPIVNIYKLLQFVMWFTLFRTAEEYQSFLKEILPIRAPDIDSEEAYNLTSNADDDIGWDVLVFTQSWPPSTCYHFKEEDKTHECLMPNDNEEWKIHGIWPNKLGTLGPSFCNPNATFDVNQLQVILDQLKLFWPSINAEVAFDWLWQHEWLKHGTCASTLEHLSNELKYFSKGLHWNNKYNMSKILKYGDFYPGNNIPLSELYYFLRYVLRKNVAIHCLYDHKKDINYLDEIRLCFNKSLTLIDCDAVNFDDTPKKAHYFGELISNCDLTKPVFYPNSVPDPIKWHDNTESEQQKEKEFLDKQTIKGWTNSYKLFQMIKWITL